jgi:N-acetyl-gamma-glutamylphosphate reductase
MNDSTFTLGIVGARGHTGAELIKLVAAHPRLKLAFVSSRERAGQRLSDHHPEFQGELQYENLDADAVAAKGVDGDPGPAQRPGRTVRGRIEAAKPDTVIVDLSADYRFDNSWYYGLPELTRGATTARSTSATRAAMPRRCSWRCIRCWTCWPVRRSASVCPATPAPAPRRRTRTTSNCWPTT